MVVIKRVDCISDFSTTALTCCLSRHVDDTMGVAGNLPVVEGTHSHCYFNR